MKKVFRKFLILVTSLFVSGASVFALDAGFLIDNDSAFKTDEEKKFFVDQKDSFYAWVKVPVGTGADKYFIAEGLYQFEYLSNTKDSFNFIDVDLFKFVYSKRLENGVIDVKAGRFGFMDLTSVIFSQVADGAFLSYRNQSMTVSAYASYTGLLNSNIVKMYNAADFEPGDKENVYNLSDKFINAAATIAFLNLFGNQTVAAQVLGSFRADSISFTRIYATLSLDGPVYKNLFYSASASIGMSSYNDADFTTALLLKGNVSYYFDKASAGAKFVFADKNFGGITSLVALNSLTEPGYSALLKAGIFGTYKPISDVLCKAEFNLAFDGLNDYELKGLEFGLSAEYQILSDLYAGAEWNFYKDCNETEFDFNKISLKIRITL